MASRPYDVLNSAEAKAEATERSLLHIIKPEIDFEPHCRRTFAGGLRQGGREISAAGSPKAGCGRTPGSTTIYAQTMDGRTQYGLTMCCHYEDYLSGAIKKHELTRLDKEEDRMIHVRNQQANIEPVFFAYPDNAEIDAIVADVVKNNDPDTISRLPTASAISCGLSATRRPTTVSRRFSRASRRSMSPTGITAQPPRRAWDRSAARKNPNHSGCEEYCYSGRDLPRQPAAHHRLQPCGEGPERPDACRTSRRKLNESFVVETRGRRSYRPSRRCTIFFLSMYRRPLVQPDGPAGHL